MLALIILYLKFLPKVSMLIKFIPRYEGVPTWYEQYISQESCTKHKSKIILQFRRLHELVADFGSLVRLAILQEYLKSCIEKSDYIRISKAWKMDEFLPATFIEVSTKGIKPWIDFHGKDKIKKELQEIVNAMLYARQACSVRMFELDSNEWSIHGCSFLDAVSDWNFKEARDTILKNMLSS